jgi:hypothetical protein
MLAYALGGSGKKNLVFTQTGRVKAGDRNLLGTSSGVKQVGRYDRPMIHKGICQKNILTRQSLTLTFGVGIGVFELIFSLASPVCVCLF